MLGVIATDMIVAGGRSLYRPLEEAERQRGLGHRGVGEGETTEGQGPSVFGTEGRAEQSEVMKEPLAAGENEFKDAAVDTVPSGPMARVAAIKSEVKTEPNVKVEYDGGQSQMGEYGYGTSHDNFGADDEEEVEITPQRGPSGFISRHTGPEAGRIDRPAFGWSWRATKGSSATSDYGMQTSGYGPGPTMKSV
ncbi:hypothetical protein PC123_g25613 [Phytophthora cactorum]|nr:hypothetical protein PC120_g20799 [Phytophthora cactorum]KAG4038828.1 hypothetical protein PC123_g25613 [Phytophthora cactorum]